MESPILRAGTRFLAPLMLLFSVFLLLRGHNEPGGGFVGGLVAATAFALVLLAAGLASARSLLRFDPRDLIGFGLAISLLSGVLTLPAGRPFMTGLWLKAGLPVLGKLGSPVLFDAGVYCVVLGIVLAILFALAEGDE